MKILKIGGENLASINNKFEIDLTSGIFKDNGLFSITGPTGAGKTTILDAMTLALYGMTNRLGKNKGVIKYTDNVTGISNNDTKNIMSYGKSDCNAYVYFSIDERGEDNGIYKALWSVRRAKNSATGNFQDEVRVVYKVLPSLEEQECISGKKSVEQFLNKLIGLDWEKFKKIVVLPQGSFAVFLQSNDVDRSALLEQITGTEIYRKISMEAFSYRKNIEIELKTKKDNLITIKKYSEDDNKQACEFVKENIPKKDELDELFTQFGIIENIEKNIVDKNTILEEANLNLQRVEQEIKNLTDSKLLVSDYDCCSVQRTNHELTVNLAKKINELQSDIKNAEKEFEVLEHCIKENSNKQTEDKKNFDDFMRNYTESCGKIENAKLYDKQLLDIAKQINNSQSSYDDALKEKEEFEQIKETLENELSDLQLKKNNYLAFLNEHSDMKNYYDKSENICKYMGELIKNEHQLIEYNKAWQEIEIKLRDLYKKKEDFTSLVNDKNAELNNCRDDEKILQNKYAEYCNNEILKNKKIYTDNHEYFSYVKRCANDFTSKFNDLEEKQKELFALKEDLQNINSSIEEHISREEELIKNEELCKNHLDEIRQQSGLSAFRAKLKIGDHCPLCNSIVSDLTSQLESLYNEKLREAENSYDRAKQDHNVYDNNLCVLKDNLSDVQLKVSTCENIYNTLYEQLLSLCNTLDGEAKSRNLEINWLDADGNIDKQIFTRSLSIINEKYDDCCTYLEQCSEVEKQISDLKELVDKKRLQQDLLINSCQQSQQDLNKLISVLEEYELNQASLKTEKQESEHNLESCKNFLKDNMGDTWQDLFNTIIGDEQSIDEKIKIIEKWKDDCKLYEEYNEKIKEVTDLINNKNANISNHKSNLDGANIKLRERLNQLVDLNEQQEYIRKNRFSVLENPDTDDALNKLEAQKNDLENLLNEIDNLCSDLSIKKAEKATQLNNRNNELSNSKVEYQEAIKDINEFLNSHNITHSRFDEVMNVTIDEIKKIREKISDSETNLQDAKTRVETLSNDLESEKLKLRKTINAIPNVVTDGDSLDDAWKQRQIDMRKSLDEQIANNRAIMEFYVKQEKAIKELNEEIEQLESKASSTSRVCNVIASQKGDTFTKFVQSITFRRLVAFANQHLLVMNRRYQLVTVDNDDTNSISLGLQVIDNDQGGYKRGSETLSGGESFIVSLALALSMAELSNVTCKVQSLFIDEGFGTLDPKNLDMVIKALDSLQQTGRQIGVITHVEGIIERIAAQVEVVKVGLGSSKVLVHC